jgi:hypothetical protein
MRQWLNILAAFSIGLAASGVAPAMAQPGMMMSRPAMAVRGTAARPIRRPGEPVTGNAQKPDHGFYGRPAFAVAAYGYVGDYGYGVAPAGYDALAGAQVPAGGYPPPFVYYQRPPQLTCLRPRLITIGTRPSQTARLPKVVYGGPLPCGFKG